MHFTILQLISADQAHDQRPFVKTVMAAEILKKLPGPLWVKLNVGTGHWVIVFVKWLKSLQPAAEG